MLSLPFTLLLTFALTVFVVGVLLQTFRYLRHPNSSISRFAHGSDGISAIVSRLSKELFFFRTLFRSNKPLWLMSWLFHFSLLWLVVGHLYLIFDATWLLLVKTYNGIAAEIAVASLFGLWLRRFISPLMRRISTPSDHLMLLLLMVIVISGWLTLLSLHMVLAALLLILFPLSKLMHAPGLLLSPSRVQRGSDHE